MVRDNDESNFIPITLNGVLAATEKLLAVNRQVIPPDERDSLEFKTIRNLDDHLKERIQLDADKLRLSTMRKLNRSKSLDSIMPGAFNAYGENLIVGNQLSSPLEEINPMSLIEASRRLSQMGEGGLPSSQAISVEAQNVHPSEFGFLDTISGPESEKIGVDTRLAEGAMLGDDGQIYQRFYDPKLKKYKWLSPIQTSSMIIGLPD